MVDIDSARVEPPIKVIITGLQEGPSSNREIN